MNPVVQRLTQQPLFYGIAYIAHLDPASAGDLTFTNTKFTHQSNCVPLSTIFASDIFVFRAPGGIKLAALLNNSVAIFILNLIILLDVRAKVIAEVFTIPFVPSSITNNTWIARDDANRIFTSNSFADFVAI